MESWLQALKIFALVLLGFAVYQLVLRIIRHYWHFPAPAFLTLLLNSQFRARLQPPIPQLLRCGVRTGQHVMEIGCGGGFFLPYAARMVGSAGKVYGLDISSAMLRRSRKYLLRWPPEIREHIELLQENACHIPLPDESLDVVYYILTLMEIPDPLGALTEARRVLKKDGVLAICEGLMDPDYPGQRTTIRCAEAAGFQVEAVEGNFFLYTVRCIKADPSSREQRPFHAITAFPDKNT